MIVPVITYLAESIVWKVIISAALCVAAYLLLIRRPRICKGVPVLKSDSILGCVDPLVSIGGRTDAFKKILDITERIGSITQFFLVNHHVVMINDKRAAKLALNCVHGKGSFHEILSGQDNIFSLDTNTAWKLRRQAFRHSFAVRHHEHIITQVAEAAKAKLNDAADSGCIVLADEFFSRLAVEVICKVAFQFDMNAFEDSITYNCVHKELETILRLSWVQLIPGWRLMSRIRLPIEPIASYRSAMCHMEGFQGELLSHIRFLQAAGALDPQSFAAALLDFAQLHSLSEEEILAEIFIVFLAGHETTSHTLSWLVYALAKNQEVQQRCQSAIDQHDTTTAAPDADAADATTGSPIKKGLSVTAAAATKAATDDDLAAAVSPTFIGTVLPESPTRMTTRTAEQTEAGQYTPSSGGLSDRLPTAAGRLLPDYAEAVLKEVLRRFPVADRGSIRLVKDDAGFTIPYSTLHPTTTRTEEEEEEEEEGGGGEEEHKEQEEHIGEEKQPDEVAHKGEEEEGKDGVNGDKEGENGRGKAPASGIMQKLKAMVGAYFRSNVEEAGGNIVVPKGSWVLVNFYALHNSSTNWGSDALQFKPERWLPTTTAAALDSTQPPSSSPSSSSQETGESKPQHSPLLAPTSKAVDAARTDMTRNPLSSAAIYAGGGVHPDELMFAPFSYGPRNCIGMRLALLELRVVMKMLLKNFSFQLADDIMQDEDTVLQSTALLTPLHELPVLVERR